MLLESGLRLLESGLVLCSGLPPSRVTTHGSGVCAPPSRWIQQTLAAWPLVAVQQAGLLFRFLFIIGALHLRACAPRVGTWRT